MLLNVLNPFKEILYATISNVHFKKRLFYAALGSFIFSMAANGFAYLNFFHSMML